MPVGTLFCVTCGLSAGRRGQPAPRCHPRRVAEARVRAAVHPPATRCLRGPRGGLLPPPSSGQRRSLQETGPQLKRRSSSSPVRYSSRLPLVHPHAGGSGSCSASSHGAVDRPAPSRSSSAASTCPCACDKAAGVIGRLGGNGADARDQLPPSRIPRISSAVNARVVVVRTFPTELTPSDSDVAVSSSGASNNTTMS